MLYARLSFVFLLLTLSPAGARNGLLVNYAPPAGYYDGAEGLLGTDLKAVLHQRIAGHRALIYGSGGTVAALRVLDAMPGDPNQVRLLYWGTGRNASNYGGNAGQWNHEHCWPQSYGVGSGSGNSDLFNLRPCDVQANNERGSLFYAEITTGNIPSFSPSCRKTTSQWMPRPEEKGDLARAMFYMAVRYEGGEPTPDLELSDLPSPSDRRFGRLSDLLRWHRDDPVDDEERRRNHLVYTDYQYNRNPFVDDPDYAEMVFRAVPVVRVTAIQPTATEGSTEAVVRIGRRGPWQSALSIDLSYAGTAGVSAWQSVPASVTIPAGAQFADLVLTPLVQPGEQGVRNFMVSAATADSYAPVGVPAEVALVDSQASSFRTWSGGLEPNAALVLGYAIGGATSPNTNDGVAASTQVTQTNLSITVIVRTNDPNLTVLGQSIVNLGAGSWVTNDVNRITNGVDQAGVPAGNQRQIFSAPLGTDGKKFLRLQTTLSSQ